MTPEVPNGITGRKQGPRELCSQHLVAGPLMATVMLGSTQSGVGIYLPGEHGALLPRIKATRVGSQLPLTLVHFVGPCECYMRLGSTWLVWFLVTIVARGYGHTTESGGAHTTP